MSNSFRTSVLVVALMAPAPLASYAQMANPSEIGPDDNTSTPAIVFPPTTPAPQTSLSPPPPIGEQSLSGFQPTIAVHPMGGSSLSR
jgi:hypothetical protein